MRSCALDDGSVRGRPVTGTGSRSERHRGGCVTQRERDRIDDREVAGTILTLCEPSDSGSRASPAPTEPAWADVARRAEDHGYDVLSMPDHLDGTFAPLVALGLRSRGDRPDPPRHDGARRRLPQPGAARRTRSSPSTSCRATGSSWVSGAGWRAADYATAGIPFAPAVERIDRLAAVVRQRAGGAAVRSAADAGGGGRRMLDARRAGGRHRGDRHREPGRGGRRARRVGATLAATREKVAWVREAAGEGFDRLELNVRVWSTVDRDAAVALGADAVESPHVMAPTRRRRWPTSCCASATRPASRT